MAPSSLTTFRTSERTSIRSSDPSPDALQNAPDERAGSSHHNAGRSKKRDSRVRVLLDSCRILGLLDQVIQIYLTGRNTIDTACTGTGCREPQVPPARYVDGRRLRLLLTLYGKGCTILLRAPGRAARRAPAGCRLR